MAAVAFTAQALDGQARHVGGEAVGDLQLLGEGVERLPGGVVDVAAAQAHQVVVGAIALRALGAGDLIDGRPADGGRADQPQLAEEIERPVDGGAVNGREAAVHALIQRRHGDVAAHLAQGVEDDLALGGQLVAAAVQDGG